MYNIMVRKSNAGVNSTWGFLTETINDRTKIKEFSDLQGADTYIEEALNDGIYRKTDLMVVQQYDFEIEANLYDNASTTDSEDGADTETV